MKILKIALSTLLTDVLRPADYHVNAQGAGNLETEGNPTITLKECTIAGGCTSSQAKVTLDANWRHIHVKGGYENCYTGNKWGGPHCSSGDPEKCAKNCDLEQISEEKYKDTYGIDQLANGFRINFVTDHKYGTNVGGRLYVLDGDDKYKMWHLKNREFAVDIDVSELQCGMNGALYFVEMDELGGKNLGDNQAGAKYGTGYCDAQCPHDMKFISGEANVIDWKPNEKDFSENMGMGKYGSCCAEMDIWEANSMATAYTPHPCNLGGNGQEPAQYKCEGIDCGDNDKGQRYKGVCDKDGCDINPYRMGNKQFYGRGDEYEINTLKPMTVVTQFLTTDGTDDGELSEIRRFYVQDGNVIPSPKSTILSKNADSITDGFCKNKKKLFGDINDFKRKGGNAEMGNSLDRGHVLALSLWDDVEVNMLWLDSAFPLDKPATDPGVKRGECLGGETSTPKYVRDNYPNGGVTFENVAIGEIGSTLIKSPTSSPTRAPCALCSSQPNKNQPECTGQSETRCKQMAKNENKCMWNECPPTAPPVQNKTPSPTASPIAAPKFHAARATTEIVVMGGVVKANRIAKYVEMCGCLQDLKADVPISSMNALAKNPAAAMV
eukprot:CAMPEP_0194274870 /NCGR_PEP_ID=MMETSP0169-20130528/7856_1 /TAXON_ID=218684 /ORGANISM="Corethron pennatum, Strain L29A3" /LENGTH=607 /DNA_ID=CAMNT_0039018201 /DNA_START=70 /DNA_END=1894 /DNA_ORIENTATION=+